MQRFATNRQRREQWKRTENHWLRMNTDEFTDEPINDNGSLEEGSAKGNVTEQNDLIEGQDLQNEPTPQQQQQDPEDKKNKVDVDSFYTSSVVKQPQKESDGQNAYISYLIETEVSIHFFTPI
jgi:sorting nexin-4